ncbi:DUF6504 family protein [Zafaria sp. Z1313]|uniref:DUF6504 family protein n=1 Tax=unclassified Zafaria TaxID=2828765 RepID=UPI002E7815BA|nr:DUF6504 family protein [Zafaria sp. J156]MEE1621090.1 DUF6504 family protein [Zafaria sp. J156]
MGLFTRSIDVDCTTSGLPLRLRWEGREYLVAAEPLRWFERRKWWAEELRAERGRGPGLVDHEMWRIQARLAGRGPLRTFDLSRHAETGRWRLVMIHDALKESA